MSKYHTRLFTRRRPRTALYGGIALAAVVALLLVAMRPAQGQSARDPSAPVALTPSPEAGQIIQLTAGSGRMMTLPAPVKDVVVVNPAIADVVVTTPRQVYVLAKKVGTTSIAFIDAQGREVQRVQLHSEIDAAALREAIRRILPTENVEVNSVSGTIHLTGTVRSPAAATAARDLARRFVENDDGVINAIRILSEQQVLLQVRVAEVQRTVLKQLGFEQAFASGSFVFASPTTAFDTAAGAAALTTQLPEGTLRTVLNALEREGLVKTLAEPNLTAVSGENASMLAGGEFPIPVAQTNDAISIEYKPFGVALNFTPVVLSGNRISLKVSTEVSGLSEQKVFKLNDIELPTLAVRRAASTVELPSGGSIVIAGLLQNDMTNSIQGLPGLMDLPILGALFRSASFSRNESELVVTVTAFLVKPVDSGALASPIDGLPPPNDLDLYLFGRLHGLYAPGQDDRAPPRLAGPFGYILE